MAKAFARTNRVAEQMQRELAQLIQFEVKDPRVGLVTVTDVEVTPDYSHAKVFFTMLGSEDHADTQKALERAAGFLRSQLGVRMKLRTVPQLHFIYDESVERGMTLSRLIDEAVASDQRPEADDSGSEKE